MSDDITFDKSFDLTPGRAEEVLPGVRRIVADNPGPFTFKGTLSYIVGRGKVAIIDPGPDDERHIEALLGAVQRALALDAETRIAREQSRQWRQLYEALTPREREVFDHVVAGRLNKQTAAELGATERTVKAHRARVMEKMRVGSLAELVQVAQQLRATGAPSAVHRPSA